MTFQLTVIFLIVSCIESVIDSLFNCWILRRFLKSTFRSEVCLATFFIPSLILCVIIVCCEDWDDISDIPKKYINWLIVVQHIMTDNSWLSGLEWLSNQTDHSLYWHSEPDLYCASSDNISLNINKVLLYLLYAVCLVENQWLPILKFLV